MLMILSCHFVANIGWGLENFGGVVQSLSFSIDQYFGQVGVCIFFTITGFFLVKKDFRLSRVVRTVVQTFFTLFFLSCL